MVRSLANNPRLKNNRLISMSGQNIDKNPFLGVNGDEAGEKLKQNHNKQAKLADAYLENILGEDVFRGKMEKLREEESQLQNILAGIELAAVERERSSKSPRQSAAQLRRKEFLFLFLNHSIL